MKKILTTILLTLSIISAKSQMPNDTLKIDVIRHSKNFGQVDKISYEDLTGRKINEIPQPGIYIQISSEGRKLIKVN